MFPSRVYFWLPGWFLAFAVILVDQWSKAEVIAASRMGSLPVTLLPFFNLVLVWNKGVSFGMFSRFPEWMPVVLTLISSLVVLALMVWLLRARARHVVAALGFIIGGAMGNIIDRARFGAVTDFIDAHWGAYHWPSFNVADSAIFIGVVILLFIGHSKTGKKYDVP